MAEWLQVILLFGGLVGLAVLVSVVGVWVVTNCYPWRRCGLCNRRSWHG